MGAPHKIAIVQAAFTAGDVPYNLQRMRAFVHACKERHPSVKLVLFPELAATGYFLSPRLRECAEKKDGPIFREMSAAARESGVYVGYGYAEREEGTEGAGKAAEHKMYNSFALLDDEGNLAAHYRKIHLTTLERDLFAPGREFVTADTPLGKAGLLICWDLAFPEAARKLTLPRVTTWAGAAGGLKESCISLVTPGFLLPTVRFLRTWSRIRRESSLAKFRSRNGRN